MDKRSPEGQRVGSCHCGTLAMSISFYLLYCNNFQMIRVKRMNLKKSISGSGIKFCFVSIERDSIYRRKGLQQST